MRANQGTQQAVSRTSALPYHPIWQNGLAILLVIFLALSHALDYTRFHEYSTRVAFPTPVWGHKPVLGYFVFTSSLVERLPGEAGLTATNLQSVERIAKKEQQSLHMLMHESSRIINDENLSLEEKRSQIYRMGYNAQVLETVRDSRQKLIYSLGPYAFTRLSRWIEHQWQVERKVHGSPLAQSNPRTYRVYATRYDSGGAYTVALPDKCLKFANGGNSVCNSDGYIPGYGYSVFISYEKSTAATVNESGPWNVDDNFWATTNDPTPRRMFADLNLGMPEAQAAYFNGYNGGTDQFGRVVTAPFGIDLARQVSIDIGLQPGNNDWIDVSFLWTENWDSGSGAIPPQPGSTGVAAPTLATIIPIAIAPPGANGSIVHVVQEGQTLWNIAAAYQVDLSIILSLNGITDGAVIIPGQNLLIKPASPTSTPTSSSISPSPIPTRNILTSTPVKEFATAVAQVISTPFPDATPIFSDDEPIPDQTSALKAIDPILAGIAALAVVGALLLILGQRFNRRE